MELVIAPPHTDLSGFLFQKEYFKHSGYPGGEKMIKFEEMMEKSLECRGRAA